MTTAHLTADTTLLPTIKGWEMYLQDQGKSIYTIKAFVGDLNLLASYSPADITLGKITTADLNHFLNWLQNGRGIPCSPKSYARRITSLKSFFRWLFSNAIIPTDPAEKIVQKSVISPIPIVLTEEEIAQVMLTAKALRSAKKPDARPFTLLFLLLTTGIKKGECLGINLNHVELDDAAGPFVYIRYSGSQNRYKERKIDLSSEWVEAYQEYLKQYQPMDQLFPWSPRRLEYILEEVGNVAGLAKHLSFDMCRWTAVLSDWQDNVDRDLIRQKLGISKIQWREISQKLAKLDKLYPRMSQFDALEA
jgi:site-specific recombinase XerD